MRLLGQALHATLQELEFPELRLEGPSKGRPRYCQGLFDAITAGEILIHFFLRSPSCLRCVFVTGKRAPAGARFFPPLSDQNETVFVFRANVYWMVSADGRVGGPLPLRRRWSHLPVAIEAAAFSPLDSKWYFFKGASPASDCN